MLKRIIYLLIVTFFLLLIWNPVIEDCHQYIPKDVPYDLRSLVPNNIKLMDAIFGFCVWLLLLTGNLLGVSYNEANIWIFVFLWPSIIILMFIYIMHLRSVIKSISH